ncbi:DUF1254 domain-containing protein [Rhodococcus sp. BP-316]|uniref:DUF1254 domain-containing protein n=1 Tax=Rhodococcus sp. BP-316 TaxID=2739445 RepID=UPI001C9AEF88|nr:DUF1214 domain-containing protein [Rhodococcus sp. BP-316]MBY6682940.1 DUF1254 domain-containing protein [Rhodococcus sp. BP-316]
MTAPDCSDGGDELFRDARALQIWGFPLVFAQRLRLRFTSPLEPDVDRPLTSAGAALNTMGHQRRLSDPTLTAGVAPNVDTLYSLAFVDLDVGSFTLRMPDLGDRYYCIQLGEADSTTIAVQGLRTHGSRLPTLHIVRSGSEVVMADDELLVACRTRHVMVAVRILVRPDDAEDLRRVIAVQDAIVLDGPRAPGAACDAATRTLVLRERDDELRDPEAFLDSLDHAVAGVAAADVPPAVRESMARLRRALHAGEQFTRARSQFAAGLSDGLDAIADRVRSLGRTTNGWSVNELGTDFGDDHLLRAAVALSQIYVNPADEALYPVCEVDDGGRPLSGAHSYDITFAAGEAPPARFFWSLTVYHKRGLLCENSIGRYAITDRTPGVTVAHDGSLTVRLASTPPAEGTSNWLPTPSGDFRLMLRLYGPSDRAWSPPVVRRTPARSSRTVGDR